MKVYALLFTFLFPLLGIASDTQHKLVGYVYDSESGEVLVGATVLISQTENGAATNFNGLFSLNVPHDSTTQLKIQYLGYEAITASIFLKEDTIMSFYLTPVETHLQEIVVKNEDRLFYNANSHLQKIDMSKVNDMPALLGEQDIIKIMQMKPGISSGGEASSGLFVRGGKSGQNLFLLDGMEIYNPTHLFGFFSIFNPDVLQSANLYKGDFPSQFGGRTSSVVDIKMKNASDQEFKGSGGVGLISSRMMLEIPLVKNKSGLLVSARRTYADLFTEEINKANEDDPAFNPIPRYYFYDFNARFHYNFNDRHQLSVSSYFGQDDLHFNDQSAMDFLMDWGNFVFSVNSQHQFTDKLFVSNNIGHTRYAYGVNTASDFFSINLNTKISDYVMQSNLIYQVNENYNLLGGIKITEHQFTLNQVESESKEANLNLQDGELLGGTEYGAYLSNQFSVGKIADIEAGIRLSTFDNNQSITNLEPRLNFIFLPKSALSFKASYAETYQYVHLLANSGVSLPTDFWHPSNQFIDPQFSRQVMAGLNYQLSDDFVLSNEFYYRHMDNVIDFKDGGRIFINNDLQDELVFGKGWSYGNEFYLEKKNGKFTGWISYTLSWTWREFDEINEGQKFPGQNDIRHNFSTVLQYDISPRFSLSANWVYSTGNVTTLPAGRIIYQGVQEERLTDVPVYQERNSFRLRDYNRLDIGVKYTMKHKWGESFINLGVYNAYNRRNPYHIYFAWDESALDRGHEVPYVAKQLSLFPIIPSVTYSFKF